MRNTPTATSCRPGFTLPEVLITVGILGILGSVSVSALAQYQVRTTLELAAQMIDLSLHRARALAVGGIQGSEWGVRVPDGVLFKGQAFATRDTSFDELYPIPPAVTTTGLEEVTFSRVRGAPSATGAVTLAPSGGGPQHVTILVTPDGLVQRQQ